MKKHRKTFYCIIFTLLIFAFQVKAYTSFVKPDQHNIPTNKVNSIDSDNLRIISNLDPYESGVRQTIFWGRGALKVLDFGGPRSRFEKNEFFAHYKYNFSRKTVPVVCKNKDL